VGHFHIKHWKLGYLDTAEAIQYQILGQVQTAVRALGLTSLASGSVVVKKLPLERVKRNDALSYPICIITPEQGPLNPMAGDNVNDDIVYGVGVNLADSDNQERTLAANLNKYLLWLQKIRKAFHNKRLSGINTVWTCHVSPMPPVSTSHWMNQLWASGHLLKFISRENRNS
jgi:hypothetical protein